MPPLFLSFFFLVYLPLARIIEPKELLLIVNESGWHSAAGGSEGNCLVGKDGLDSPSFEAGYNSILSFPL